MTSIHSQTALAYTTPYTPYVALCLRLGVALTVTIATKFVTKFIATAVFEFLLKSGIFSVDCVSDLSQC